MKTRTPRTRKLAVRGIVVAVVLALFAVPAVVWASTNFTDVPDGNVHHDAIDAIADAGVTLGCATGLYCPADFVRRDQMASFLDRLGALSGQPPVVNAADSAQLGGIDAERYRFINLQTFGADLDGATVATSGFAGSGILMPGGNDPADRSSLAWGFQVPPDYTAGDVLTVHLTWHTPSTSCGIELRPNFVNFAHVGQAPPGGVADAGLAAVGGNVLNASATANEVMTKEYTIDASARGGIVLEPHDSVQFGLFRATDGTDDTCADALVVHSAAVTY